VRAAPRVEHALEGVALGGLMLADRDCSGPDQRIDYRRLRRLHLLAATPLCAQPGEAIGDVAQDGARRECRFAPRALPSAIEDVRIAELGLDDRVAVGVERRVQGVILRRGAARSRRCRAGVAVVCGRAWMFQKCAPIQLAYVPTCSVITSRMAAPTTTTTASLAHKLLKLLHWQCALAEPAADCAR